MSVGSLPREYPSSSSVLYLADARARITKTPMVVGGRDVLIYTTLGGSVGALIPFTSKSDVDFMTDLEMVRPPPLPPTVVKPH